MMKKIFARTVHSIQRNRQLKKIKQIPFLWDNLSLLKDLYYDSRELAQIVAVENTTACNRRCPYCPHFWVSIQKNQMPESLFKKFVDDLSDCGYDGVIIFAPWGEALLDERLAFFVKYSKLKLPKCHVLITTNGDILTLKKFKELVNAGVDVFDVSDHFTIQDNHYVIDEPKQAIQTYLQLDSDDKERIHFHDMNYKRIRRIDMFHNRSGLIPLKNDISLKSFCQVCNFPEEILSINWKGNVMLCARQWKDNPKYGNIQDEHIKDIWKKSEYSRIRTNLRKGSFELELCQNCGFGNLLDPVQINELKASEPQKVAT